MIEDQCEVREISRKPLVVEGGYELFVQPNSLTASGGAVLLAGEGRALWTRDSNGQPVRENSDSVFGAIIPRKGTACIVPSPINSALIGGVWAVGRGDGTWSVVFAELPPEAPRFGSQRTASRLWHGVYDGAEWVTLEPLPLPTEGRVQTFLAAAPVVYGDTIAWAARILLPENRLQAIFFERRDGQWSYEIVPSHGVVYVNLARADSAGLILAVVQPDTSLRRDSNSLFVYVREPSWRVLRKVLAGGPEQGVHDPSLILVSETGVLTWLVQVPQRGWEARVMFGDLARENEPTLTLDTAVEQLVPIARGTQSPLWVSGSVASDGQTFVLRLLRTAEGDVQVIGTIASPFPAPYGFHATGTDSSEILIAGPRITDDPPMVVSLLLRIRVHCDRRSSH